MDENRIERYYSVDRLRLILMFLFCLNLFGFPFSFGGYVQIALGFVAPTFFVISGFLVLRPSPNRSARILRSIKRTAIVFAVLVFVYFFVNVVYAKAENIDIFSTLKSKRTWFSFIVLNVWPFPVGSSIWMVQALLYTYIVIFFLDKFNLLRFDWIIAVCLILFATLSGELAGIINFNLLGYKYISGNFLTRGIPYILLGAFISRKIMYFRGVHPAFYLGAILLGGIMVFGEIYLLNLSGKMLYYGHFLGMVLMATAICMFSFLNPDRDFNIVFLSDFETFGTKYIYYICPIVNLVLNVLFLLLGENVLEAVYGYLGILTFIASMLLVVLVDLAVSLFRFIRDRVLGK